MSIRFAGSRCVDERRRRRLAQEADGQELPELLAARKAAALRAARGEDGHQRRGSSPADTLISPRLWKHALVGLTAVLSGLAVLLIGDRADQAKSGMESILGLAQGKLSTFFSTVMLLAAGQLAFITLWYRSRSRKDFNGSYKLWFWTAASWLVMCALHACGAHWSLADAVLAGRPMAIWNGRLIVWMIPTAIAVASLYVLLRREMRDCRESLWTLRLACGVALVNASVLLFGQFGLESRVQHLADAGLAMAWHGLLAFSMLLHARHAIHVSNEPPSSPFRPFRWSRLLPWRLFRREAASDTEAAATTADDKQAERKLRARKSSATVKKPKTARRQPVSTPIESDADESRDEAVDQMDPPESDVELEVVTRPAMAAKPVVPATQPVVRRVDPPAAAQPVAKPHIAAAPQSRVDEEPEESEWNDSSTDDDDQPLSKKERRRQKQLERQQARARR
jgi:hypothetical protein